MFLTQPFDERMKTGGMLVQPPSVGLVSGNIHRVLLKDGMSVPEVARDPTMITSCRSAWYDDNAAIIIGTARARCPSLLPNIFRVRSTFR